MHYTYLRTEADLQSVSTVLLDLVRNELEEWKYTADMRISFDDILGIVKFLRDADVPLTEELKDELELAWKTVGVPE